MVGCLVSARLLTWQKLQSSVIWVFLRLRPNGTLQNSNCYVGKRLPCFNKFEVRQLSLLQDLGEPCCAVMYVNLPKGIKHSPNIFYQRILSSLSSSGVTFSGQWGNASLSKNPFGSLRGPRQERSIYQFWEGRFSINGFWMNKWTFESDANIHQGSTLLGIIYSRCSRESCRMFTNAVILYSLLGICKPSVGKEKHPT